MDDNSITIKYGKYVSKLHTFTKLLKVIINSMSHHVDQINMHT